MTVWKNPVDWRRRHLTHKIIWGLGFGVVIPGLLLGFVKAWFDAYILPLFGVKIVELLEVPALNLVFAVLFFFGCPGLIWIAIVSFIIGVKILFEL